MNTVALGVEAFGAGALVAAFAKYSIVVKI